jgi:hypothetical protein
MKKVKKIESGTNKIIFFDTDGNETNGTIDDCNFVGGKFKSRACFMPVNTEKKPNSIGNNISTGQGNSIQLAENCNVYGNYNEVLGANFATVHGFNSKAIRHGEFVQGFSDTVARAQRSVLIFQGRTTDATETEIFLGGVDGKRFIVDEAKECVISFEARIVCKRVDGSSSAVMGKFQHATFRVTGGALDRIGINNKTNHNNGISGWTNDFVATSGDPDYIKATVTGQASATIDWTVITYVNEIRTNFI